jgi:hypothetical protein
MDNKLTFHNDEGSECEDLLHSNDYIQRFHSIVVNSDYSVYAICGDWGTGKTCFVKMWENKLKDLGLEFVHIDAFRMDYEIEPFLMFIRVFKEFMKKKKVDEEKKEKWLNKAKELFSIKNIAKLGFNILVGKTIGVEPLKEFVNNAYDVCFDKMSGEESLYDQLIASLTEITNQFDAPVYIIIDELDRCRPDFSLETLERIKHIFHVKNVKFILVYNETVLMSMINNRYGSTIDAKRYLTKFVEKKYLFDNTKRLASWFRKEIENGKKRFGSLYMASFLGEYYKPILELKSMFYLSLRDIQQIISGFESYRDISDRNAFIFILAIEFLKYVNPQEFNNMVAYYNENNKKFDANVPERGTFIRTFDKLVESIPGGMPVSSDDAFYEYMSIVQWGRWP